MGEAAEIARELRDEVLQTILAVRLSLAYSASHDDWAGMQVKSAEAQEHLAAEARRLRVLIDRLGALTEEVAAEDVAVRSG